METKMKVKVLAHTPEPERVCAAAARLCYNKMDIEELYENITEEKIRKTLEQVIKSEHHSTIEHASITFGIEGISRACTHQLVRHRLASYSQQSQRYVNEKEFSFIIPPSIAGNEEKKKKFLESMESVQKIYSEMRESGVLNEDARFLLPNATETKIVVTMNFRELWNFFELRTCTRAQWEIRVLANKMLEESKKIAPIVFSMAGAKCKTRGYCPEGKNNCGIWKTIPGCVLRGNL